MYVGKIFKTIDFNRVNEFEDYKNIGAPGFAVIYLNRCYKESKTDEEINIHVYTKLLELDARLGTTASEQLFYCVKYTQRLDLIKVQIEKRISIITILLVDKYGPS